MQMMKTVLNSGLNNNDIIKLRYLLYYNFYLFFCCHYLSIFYRYFQNSYHVEKHKKVGKNKKKYVFQGLSGALFQDKRIRNFFLDFFFPTLFCKGSTRASGTRIFLDLKKGGKKTRKKIFLNFLFFTLQQSGTGNDGIDVSQSGTGNDGTDVSQSGTGIDVSQSGTGNDETFRKPHCFCSGVNLDLQSTLL